jgi:peptidyl-prolyl cis-trans isomerase C
MRILRGAILGLALTGLTATSQTTPPAKTPVAPPPAGTSTLPPPAAAPATPKVPTTQVAATVNGEAIYEVAVQRALSKVPPARRAEARTSLIDYLVDNLLIDQSLRAANYKVEKGEVDQRVNEMKAELKKIAKDFDKMLAELQTSEQELRTHIEADLRWFKYASAQANDKVVADLFTASKDMFDGSAVRARHILLTPPGKDEKAAAAAAGQLRQLKQAIEAEVEAGLAKLPANADKLAREKARGELINDAFARHAKAKSECPTKDRGGDVSWFQKAGFMVAPFSEAAFKLQPNQMSEPVQTPFGYHLILVTERKPGKDVKLEEVKEAVKEVYFERLREGLAKQLRAKAAINVAPAPK